MAISTKDVPPDGWYQELTIKFKDGTAERFYLHFSRSGRYIPEPAREPGAWTRLEFRKCPGCPLSDQVPLCPAAKSLESTLAKLEGRTSVEIVNAIAVDGAERMVEVKWPLQQVGSVFVQLAVFSSGCPIGDQMRPYVQDLRPFSTSAEMARHMVSRMLLKHRSANPSTMAIIRAQLAPLNAVFTNLCNRLRDHSSAGSGDAIPNSIARLDAFSQMLAMQLEQVTSEIGGGLAGGPAAGAAPAEAAPSGLLGLWRKLRALLS